ncbi:hypothetical protein [Pseudoxanthomonas beigongshangi]
MSRRRRLALLSLAVLLLAGAGLLHWLLQPQRLTPALLGVAGDALGLEITASGVGEYRLRGTPQLIVRGLVAREPGATTPLLTAERVFISVPWSTLRARGRDLTAVRLELDAPVFNLAAFQHWLAGRPPGETRIPTLSDGIRVDAGRVQGDGWSLEGINLRIPHLAPDRPLRGQLQARYQSLELRAPMDLAFHLGRLGKDGGLGLAGEVTPAGKDWRLPLRLRLSAYLRQAESRLDRMILGAHADYLAGAVRQSFALGAAGPVEFADGLRLRAGAIALRGRDAMPSLDATGDLGLDDGLLLDWRGQLANWPTAWPSLPPPLGRSTSALPFALAYRGTADLADIAHLRLQRDTTRFDARFRLFEVMDWLDALQAGSGSPLPPLSGRLTAPRLEVSGATLEGVDLRLDDPALPATDTAP